MFREFPKALYRGGAWDGVSEPDCVTVHSLGEQDAQAAAGYLPFGELPKHEAAPPDPQPVKVDRRRKEFRNAASGDADN
jgi:hypothetical protein